MTGSLVLATAAALTACQTTSTGTSNADKIDAVMERAAADAKGRGNEGQSLALLEQLYKRNSSDAEVAMKYAHALRQAGYYNRAALVLGPFAKSDNLESAELAIEYASIQAAMGNYSDAEAAARKAVLLDDQSGKAYHVLGIALDAQGFHEPAQVAFEKGLDYWEGDPSPILNNMGLNLAAQGFLDEAIETLRKALATAPDRSEIERNLRIVSALQYQPPVEGMRLVPKPPRKPDSSTETISAAPLTDVDVEDAD
ncbi:MAG: hypothetical protein H6867_05540 [Rhodospirillales bacterium]|nr:hypothetical protein [Rhodospirillales bacterium]MCB9994993.1 hypothetical protein [Rhodospirillales bacterium]